MDSQNDLKINLDISVLKKGLLPILVFTKNVRYKQLFGFLSKSWPVTR
jgi:hypothetical protein